MNAMPYVTFCKNIGILPAIFFLRSFILVLYLRKKEENNMQVQRIANYTTQYSSNKTQKTNNNPSFGKIEVVKLRRNTSLTDMIWDLAGRLWRTIGDAAGFNLAPVEKPIRLTGFDDVSPTDIESIESHFNEATGALSEKHRANLKLLVTRTHDDGVIKAFVTNGDKDVLGQGQVLATKNYTPVQVAKQAITNAVRGYVESLGTVRMCSFQHRGRLARIASSNDKFARVNSISQN